MGGEDAFVGKLDSLFTADSSLEGETTYLQYNRTICPRPEPSHHVIHMYNYVNRPWRTQELVDTYTVADICQCRRRTVGK